jgi:CheY-like chemotaxis protein/HPt (histidine-containing phosphotransfer) domain-containing protein
MPDQVLDYRRLAEIVQGSGVAQDDLLSRFRSANMADAALLHQACGEGDLTQAGLLAHRIRGAATMLGAAALAQACELIALACTAGNGTEAQAGLVFFDLQLASVNANIAQLGTAGIAPPSIAVSPARADSALCSGLRFLVVEDHDFQRGIVVKLLQHLGAEQVTGFGDCACVLDAMRGPGTSSDILVLDLFLPGMDGMALMRSIGAARHSVSVILNTALSPDLLEARIQEAASCGVHLLGAVTKPLTQASLAPLIALYRHSHQTTRTGVFTPLHLHRTHETRQQDPI